MHYVNNKNEFDTVDPKDTATIALTTKLNSLEGKLKNQRGSNSGKGSYGSLGGDNNKKDRKSDKNNKQNNGLPEWHTKNKGQTYTHKRKEYIWCKEHKCNGKYNSLYMLSPHDHAALFETFKKNVTRQKENHTKGKDDKQNQPNDSLEGTNGQSSTQKLVLNDNMKAILCTNCNLTESQV
eukprot:14749033-Ditylum_brightwellii.AAC.1